MLSNVYLFTGEERFLLDRELTRRKENFVLKYGADSIFAFDFENLDMGMVKQAIYSGGLFVSKKMIILQGIPYEGTTKPSAALQEQVEKFIEEFIAKEGKIPEEALLVFVSGKPDKRLKFYKFLERNANVKEFTQYKDSELKDFIISQLPGLYIPSEVIEYFLIKVGPDLYRLWFECEKLATWCQLKQVKTIDQAMIDKVAWGMVETNAFSLLETMFTNYPHACALLDKIKDDGDDRNKFAGMLYRSLKQSLFLLDVYESGTHDSKEIAARLGANPRQISKSLKNIQQLQSTHQRMKQFFRGLVELDGGIKTGKYPDTYFWLGIKQLLRT